MNSNEPQDTRSGAYTERLLELRSRSWKRFVPDPYLRSFRRFAPGHFLDIGCGIGRLLGAGAGDGVGIDHNEESVQHCRSIGLVAFTPEGFLGSEFARPGRFDSLVCSHVLEHLGEDDADALLATYRPYLRNGARVLLITPQERGYASDASHVRFVEGTALAEHGRRLDLQQATVRSFPFPRMAGRLFVYNEFHISGTVASGATA